MIKKFEFIHIDPRPFCDLIKRCGLGDLGFLGGALIPLLKLLVLRIVS